MDDDRLKSGGSILTKEYFEYQLERIREIRLSERMFYQKITDLYVTALDYDKTAASTKRFFATVQKKMHFAIHGQTAAEVVIAKNYLTKFELTQMGRMVSAYIDFGETMALRNIPMTMGDWEVRLKRFIEMFEYGLLKDAAKVSAEITKLHALTEFEKYRVVQDRLFKSDFDRFIALEQGVERVSKSLIDEPRQNEP